jgi:hypothetical protein
MIGCDRCEEWYHFACVGIDQVSLSSSLNILKTTITDFENYEFVCPSCKKRELSKGSKKPSAKKTAVPPPTAPPAASQVSFQNKRSAKANGKQLPGGRLEGNTSGVVSQVAHDMASKNEGGSKIVVNGGSQLLNRKVTGPPKADGGPNQTSSSGSKVVLSKNALPTAPPTQS